MEYILMDLDGTIINSKTGITKSLQYTLKQWNINIENLESLTRYIGPPIKVSFMDCFGFSEEEAGEATSIYRKYFEEKGFYEDEVYEGIEELLSRLKMANKKIILATSKQENIARKVMEHFKLASYYDDICGAAPDESRAKKKDVILYALEKNGITDYSKAVMVGDRKYDIEGAKAVGISSIGVLYGFGDREELTAAGADRIVAEVKDLFAIIID